MDTDILGIPELHLVTKEFQCWGEGEWRIVEQYKN
jgi:hypothetical protein